MFLYRHVLEDAIAPDHLGKFELLRSTRPARLPTVLSADEVARLLEAIAPQRISRLMAELLYGTGLANVARCGSEILTSDARKLSSARARVTRIVS